MKAHENMAAYDGWENLNSFTQECFQRYCDAKLESCRTEVELIRKQWVGPHWTGKICELGSGNSKLLYALERDGILQDGIGLEISRTRHEFAEAFKERVASTKTLNLNANVFEMEPIKGCDLICAMDIVLQMMTPVSEDAEERLFSWIKLSLKPGGSLLAEIRDFQSFMDIINLSENKAYQFWEEFPASDPWRYCLNRLTFVEETGGRDIRWEKTFLKRDSTETSGTQCVWRPYTPTSLAALFTKHGLSLASTDSHRPGVFTAIAINS